MAPNLYQVLEANERATAEALQLLFEHKRDALQLRIAAGDSAARTELWAATQAIDTLSVPLRRLAYDRELKARKLGELGVPPPIRKKSIALSWQETTLVGLLVVSALAGLGLAIHRANSKDEVAAKLFQSSQQSANDAAMAETERLRVLASIESQAQRSQNRLPDEQKANLQREREEQFQIERRRHWLDERAASTDRSQDRARLAEERARFLRLQQEEQLAAQLAQSRVASDRMQAIQIMVQDGRYAEASEFAQTIQERQLVASAANSEAARQAAMAFARQRQEMIRRSQQGTSP